MKNVLDATLRLLETHSPKDVTLRDVARESGHGPRLIIEWFGGKGGLYGAVFMKVFNDIIESGDLFFADFGIRRDVGIAFHVLNYMQLNHRDEVLALRDELLIKAASERMQRNLGLPPDTALLVARRVTVVALGVGLFREYAGLSDDEAVTLTQDVFRISTGVEFPDNPARLPKS
jgi:AcrR family transcriptional regulator